MTPRYDYDFDPDAENNTAASIFRLVTAHEGRRVLDLGSGPGVVASALVEQGAEVVCLDSDEQALAVAAERGVQRTVVADLAAEDWAASLRGERFDTIVLADVLEHLVDPAAVLRTIREEGLLDDRGQLVVSVPNVGHEAVVLGLALGRFRRTPTGLLDATHVQFFTRDSLHALLEEEGFLVRTLHRTERTLEQTEQFQVARDVPRDLRDRIAELAPDARTYQFVVAAVPSDEAGQLAVLRERLAAERDTHVRAMEDLRTELRGGGGETRAALEQVKRELRAAHARSEAVRSNAQDTIRALRDELDRVRERAEHDAAEARRLRAALRKVEDRLELVYDSSSFRLGWRLTAPMRAVRGQGGAPVRPERITDPDGAAAPAPPPSDSPSTTPTRIGPVDPGPPREQSTRRRVYDAEVERETFSPGARGVVMLCSTIDLDAGRGDVYAACGLGLGLREHGMEAVYREHRRWSDLPEGTEVVVSFLAETTMILDPASVPQDVLRVAWIRNNTRRWIEEGSLGLYDLVLCSSQLTADEVAEHYPGPIEVLPLGVDPMLFTPGERTLRRDVVSTVNQWGRTRRTYAVLAEVDLDVPLHVYGRARNLDERLEEHHHGLVSYFEVPSLYQHAAIVLDDQQGVNAPYGNVNSRIFEALAAGALPLTASPLGLADVGLAEVPVWRRPEELVEQIRHWTEHDDERRELVRRLREVVLEQHSFDARAARFVELVTDRSRRRPPVIGFFPDYRVTNPFQDMVYAGAEGRVIRPVEGPGQLTHAPGLQDHERVFHLHWVAPILGPAGEDATEAERRAAAFLAELDEAKAAGVGIVWTIHNVLHHESRHPEIEVGLRQGIADRADLVHLLSPETRGAVAEAGYELPADRTFVGTHPSYLGVYPSAVSRAAARRELDLPDSAFVYLALGQIRPYKGLERLLEAFDDHARTHADAHLVVAGLPGRFPGVEELLEQARGTTATTVVDRHVDDDELQVFLRAADVVVLAHRRVLNSGLLWLAWSFARPVVAPDTGALSGLVDPEVGVLFDPEHEDLRPTLEAARNLTEEHGRAAFARAVAAHPRTVGTRLLAAIDAATAERPDR